MSGHGKPVVARSRSHHRLPSEPPPAACAPGHRLRFVMAQSSCLNRYSQHLNRHSNFLTRYSKFLSQHSKFVSRYSQVLSRYSSRLSPDSSFLSRDSHFLNRYSHSLSRYSNSVSPNGPSGVETHDFGRNRADSCWQTAYLFLPTRFASLLT